jgi:hypothetical protein
MLFNTSSRKEYGQGAVGLLILVAVVVLLGLAIATLLVGGDPTAMLECTIESGEWAQCASAVH